MKKITCILLIPFWFISCMAQNDNAETNQELRRIVEKYYDNQDFIGSVLVAPLPRDFIACKTKTANIKPIKHQLLKTKLYGKHRNQHHTNRNFYSNPRD